MHDLTLREWPYRLVEPKEFDGFRRDMDLYYLQHAIPSLRPPTLDNLIGSPFPFFFEFMLGRSGEIEFDTDDLRRFAAAERESQQYKDYCEDVVTYIKTCRYSNDYEHVKGGGFTCLSY